MKLLMKKNRSLLFLAGIFLALFPTEKSYAVRLDLTSVTTAPLIDLPDETINGVTYRGQVLGVDSVTTQGGDEWRLGDAGFTTDLFIRRSGASSGSTGQIVGGSTIWSEQDGTGGQTTVRGPALSSTEDALRIVNLLEGSDNTFSNVANTNASDVERLDFVVQDRSFGNT